MIELLFILDLVGVFSFSFFGAYVALNKKLDLFGIFVSALLSSLGGGTLREVILNEIPIYLTNYIYLLVVLLGMFLAIVLYKNFNKINKYYLIVDGIGLSTFAFIGAQRADVLNLGNIAIVFFAVITAVGGGIMRDIALREVPHIFSKDFYATPAIILGLGYVFFKSYMQNFVGIYTLIVLIFLLRLLAIQFNFKLWSRKK